MKRIESKVILWFGIFSLIFLVSFSFPFSIFPNIGDVGESFFNRLAFCTGSVFGYDSGQLIYHSGEDSVGMLINLFNCLFISLFLFMPVNLLVVKKRREEKVSWVVFHALRFYLILILFKYGFDKVYKWQFYHPEPNTLYTKIKDVPLDLLYWTTVGKSYWFSFVSGLIEVFCGLLLVFSRATYFGLFLSFFVFCFVFLTNLTFDITIKIYSGYLTLVSCVLLFPVMLHFYNFLKGNPEKLPSIPSIFENRRRSFLLNGTLFLFILIESQFKYFKSGNFNDDLRNRSALHGTYKVLGNSKVEFIHFNSQGYIIFQSCNDEMKDFKLKIDTINQTLKLTDYDFKESILNYVLEGDSLLNLHSIDSLIYFETVKVYSY